MQQKVKKQGIRLWDERTFWNEIIYKSLRSGPKVYRDYIKMFINYLMPESSIVPKSCYLTFCSTIQSLLSYLSKFNLYMCVCDAYTT